ncbi:hypothetical protein OG943_32360 [Amycolatopsis sp. NBC_00345]|uniref:hypothetical protein n=1 Tax=Amycolatopsis sp. NBC_00345 TaxID=2975955 RepID=UPI002E25B508
MSVRIHFGFPAGVDRRDSPTLVKRQVTGVRALLAKREQRPATGGAAPKVVHSD